jgi:hypothetical protein
MATDPPEISFVVVLFLLLQQIYQADCTPEFVFQATGVMPRLKIYLCLRDVSLYAPDYRQP